MISGKHYTVRLGGRSLFSQSSNLLERLKSSDGRPTYGLLSYGNTVYAVLASAEFQHFDIAGSFADIGTPRGERLSYAEMIGLNTRHTDVRGIELLMMTKR